MSEISLKIENLCREFEEGKIPLEEFQYTLEPLLGSYDLITKDDGDFIRKIINQLEIILYTTPNESQNLETSKLMPEILEYAKKKA